MESDGQARQSLLVGVSIALTLLSVVFVSLRTFTRFVIVRNFGKDDFAMLVATLFTIAFLAAILVLKENGAGFSGAVLTLPQMTNTLKTVVAVEIIYYLCVNAIKISILFFYLRFAVDIVFERLCKGTIYFLSTFCIVCIIVVLTQCIPLHKVWDLTGLVQATCVDTTAFFYMTSSTNIAVDIWILALPIKTLLTIPRQNREKVGIIFIFALGAFSCIGSVIRLYSIRIYTKSKDPFYDGVPVNIWSMVEINVGIYCASIPALKALVSRTQRERRKRARDANRGQNSDSDRSGESGQKRHGPWSLGTWASNEEYTMSTRQGKEREPESEELDARQASVGSQQRIVMDTSGVQQDLNVV